jgi:hypothetical protein
MADSVLEVVDACNPKIKDLQKGLILFLAFFGGFFFCLLSSPSSSLFPTFLRRNVVIFSPYIFPFCFSSFLEEMLFLLLLDIAPYLNT